MHTLDAFHGRRALIWSWQPSSMAALRPCLSPGRIWPLFSEADMTRFELSVWMWRLHALGFDHGCGSFRGKNLSSSLAASGSFVEVPIAPSNA